MSDHNKNLEQLFKNQLLLFRIYGVYPPAPGTPRIKRILPEIFFTILMLWVGSFNVGLVIQFFVEPTIMDKLSKVFYCVTTLFASTVKFYWIRRNQRLYQEQIGMLYNELFRPKNPAEDELLRKFFSTNKCTQRIYLWLTIVVAFYVTISPKLNDLEDLPAVGYYPFEAKSWLVVIFIQLHCLLPIMLMSFINVAHELWCVSFFLFAKAQLEVLIHRLERIGSNAISDAAVNLELKTCIKCHADIFEIVEKIDEAIKGPNSLQMFCSVLVLISNFYAISVVQFGEDGTIFIRYVAYQVLMLYQIFLLCYFPNEMTLTSQKASHGLYSSNWMFWNEENKKLALLAMLRFQSPIVVRTINRCFCFDLAAFTSVINTSYSYFAMLRQMN